MHKPAEKLIYCYISMSAACSGIEAVKGLKGLTSPDQSFHTTLTLVLAVLDTVTLPSHKSGLLDWSSTSSAVAGHRADTSCLLQAHAATHRKAHAMRGACMWCAYRLVSLPLLALHQSNKAMAVSGWTLQVFSVPAA